MVRTAEDARVALLFRNDSRSVVATDVVERPQLVVAAANNDHRFAGELCGDELSRLLQLIGARHDLPRVAEDRLALQFGDALVHVPGGGNGGGLVQRTPIVVRGDDVVDGEAIKAPDHRVLQ